MPLHKPLIPSSLQQKQGSHKERTQHRTARSVYAIGVTTGAFMIEGTVGVPLHKMVDFIVC